MLAAAAIFTACDDDIDQWKVSQLSQTDVVLESSDNIVITYSNMAKVVLQMTYTADGHELYLTNDSSATTTLGEGTYTLQVSTSRDFTASTTSTSVLDPIKGVNEISYTGQALNILASSLGIEYGTPGKLYFRVLHGYNSDDTRNVVYSDILEITVTPYHIDLSMAFVLNSDKDAVLDTIYSPTENGVYQGFIGTYGGWMNFWVRDNLEQTWGNYGEDGNFARADLSSNDAWNFWTGEPAGCIYLSLNTNSGNQYITYTNLATLSVGGDATADLTFDAGTITWQGTFTTTKDGATVSLSGTTLINDNGTGAAAADANSGTMTFADNGDGTLTLNGGSTGISVAKAGTYKIVVNLSAGTYTYKLTDLSGVKIYPTTVVAKGTSGELTLETELSGGLATGIYTGRYANTVAGDALTFVDGDGNTLDVTATLANASKYDISLDLTTNTVTVTEVLYEIAETLGLYYDKNYEYLQATLYSGYTDGALNGIYSGLFYKDADDWNFFAKDGNGVSFGVNSSTWDQFTFLNGSAANFWVTATQKTYFYQFNVSTETWAETEVTSMVLTGDFNSWSLESHAFTNNVDGTWTLTDVELIDEQYGPYIVFNGEWANKLFLASDGSSLTTVETGKFLIGADGAGTYDITVNVKTNSVTLTKK